MGSEGHVALDRNPGPGYDTLLLRLIPGYLLSAFPHRQFHTLTGILDSWAALPNSNPNALRAMQGGSLYHFFDGLWYDPITMDTGSGTPTTYSHTDITITMDTETGTPTTYNYTDNTITMDTGSGRPTTYSHTDNTITMDTFGLVWFNP